MLNSPPEGEDEADIKTEMYTKILRACVYGRFDTCGLEFAAVRPSFRKVSVPPVANY